MRAFGIFSIAAAAFAFVPAIFAAPLEANSEVTARGLPLVPAVVPGVPIATRDDDACSGILVGVKADIQVHVDVLNGLTADTCTKDTLEVTLKAIVSIVADATVKLKALVGTGCMVDISVCAQLIADILLAICGALSFVLSIVADVEVLLGVIVDVALGDCLCALISAVLALVDGLLLALVPLVLSLAGVLLKLGLDVVGQLLTIC